MVDRRRTTKDACTLRSLCFPSPQTGLDTVAFWEKRHWVAKGEIDGVWFGIKMEGYPHWHDYGKRLW